MELRNSMPSFGNKSPDDCHWDPRRRRHSSRLLVGRPFDTSCTGLDNDCRQSIDLMDAVSAERNSTFVRDVPGRLRHSDELRRSVASHRFIL